MDVIIDKFGRVVIPKIIRQQLGLNPGSILQVVLQDRHILLKTEEGKPPVERKGKLVVFTGAAVGDLESELKNIRDKRLKKFEE